jgi:uncharacterized membrane protein
LATISIVAALVVVAVFWAVVIPRIGHYWAMRQETSNPELEKVLRSINPPAETRLVEIETVKENGIPVVVATYSTSSDCDGVRAHYKQEFLKHGFTYEDENQDAGPGDHGHELFFTRLLFQHGLQYRLKAAYVLCGEPRSKEFT